MDTSKEYIKMCEKAYPYLPNPRTIGLPTLWAKDYDPFHLLLSSTISDDEAYWPIYRQDQLQEMVRNKPFDMGLTALENVYFEIAKPSDTWEQLWLTCVMHEKCGKIWDDEKEEWE